MNRDDMIPATIIACCILHNICLEGIDDNNEDFIDNEYNDAPNYNEIVEEVVIAIDANGEAKRNYT